MKKKSYPKECFACTTFDLCLLTPKKREICPCRNCLVRVMCMSACDSFKNLKNMGFSGSKIVIHKISAEF
jgi:hypothetical protein